MTVINFVYAHTQMPGYVVHKGSSSVVWSCEPLEDCEVYLYSDAFSYRGPQAGLDVLMLCEPVVVLPGQYREDIWQRFDHVLTWLDPLADKGGKFQKILVYAYDIPWNKDYVKVADLTCRRAVTEKKNAICMINGNKASSIPGELYSKRGEIARWFHEHSRLPFDAYGQPPFHQLPNYRGGLEPYAKKFDTLSQYRYALAFENLYHPIWSQGFVTEKILDCFACQTVPIYLGCYNIEDYLPKECFIDFRQFEDLSDLDRFLNLLSDHEYRSYIKHIGNWVNEGNLDLWSIHRLYDKLVALADLTVSEHDPAKEPWKPGLAPHHANRQWRVMKSPMIWSWEALASKMASEKVFMGECTFRYSEKRASREIFAGKDILEPDISDDSHILKMERIKGENHSLLPEFIEKLVKIFGVEIFVETGTFLGNTADAAKNIFREVHTIELSQDLYEAAARRFAQFDHCHTYQGDSLSILREILPRIKGKILFWLDAHYSEGITAKGKNNTPILAELRAIRESGKDEFVILIDDIRHFQPAEKITDENSALQGYPTLQQVHDEMTGLDGDFILAVLGDTALIYPSREKAPISALVQACTMSRLFDGKNTSVAEVLRAEETISAAQGQELETVKMLATSTLATGSDNAGGHYRLWYGLRLDREKKYLEACKEFFQAIDRGCNHWRVLWYLAQAAYKAGQSELSEKALMQVLAHVPEFEKARVLLEQSSAVQKWFKDKGDSTLRLDYPLTEDSMVFDVGGYRGQWSQKIVERYNPYIYIFEPVPEFYSSIVEIFRDNPKVSVFNFGLFDRTKTAKMVLAHDGSSLYGSEGNEIEIPLVDIHEFLERHQIKEIDLIKVNIEGAEYPLLERMIDQGVVERCHNIQIQFHAFYPDAVKLRNKVRDALQKTHFQTYDYPFVWESWRRNSQFPEDTVSVRNEKENDFTGIIFSKDRSMQLEGTLRSFTLHCKDRHCIDIKVLYKASKQFHERQYQRLMSEYDHVEFLKETDFKRNVLSLLSSCQYVLFLVDDNIFTRDFYLSDALHSLDHNPDSLGFSLRLGKNTTYCYMLNKGQRLPDFEELERRVWKYDWTEADFDFGYPLELSSSIYRVEDLLPLLDRVDFPNPNRLELLLDNNKSQFKDEKNWLLCYERSVTFCNPVNMVQREWDNRSGKRSDYSTQALAQLFKEGYRIDVEKYSEMTLNACHQEVELDFVKREPLISIIILNFNRLNDLRVCLDSIKRNTPEKHEIILVDNASTDGSLDYLRAVQNITLVENPENMGCPPARAQALALANGDYVVFLDNDTIVTPGWLTTFLVHAQRNSHIGLLGPRSNCVSGPQLLKGVPYKDIQSLNAFARRHADQNRGNLTNTIRLVGFCMFIRRDVIDKIGAPDAQFGKFGFEDDDYTWRAHVAGFKSAIAHDVFIHHSGGPQTRGDTGYEGHLEEAWQVFKRKWALPLDLQADTSFDAGPVLAQPFDPPRHYTPIPDRSKLGPLIFQRPRKPSASREARFPRNREERLKKGEHLFQEERFQEAEEIFRECLRYNPGKAQPHNDLACLLWQTGRIEEALRELTKALEISPDDRDVIWNLGQILQSMGLGRDAHEVYGSYLKRHPQDRELAEALSSLA